MAILQMDENSSGLSLNSPRVLIALISEGSRGQGSWQGRVEAANIDFSFLCTLVKRGMKHHREIKIFWFALNQASMLDDSGKALMGTMLEEESNSKCRL